VIRSLNARNTADYWAGLTTREGRSLDDLIRLLWGPLPAQGFEFTMARDAAGARFDCRRCPINDLAADLQAAGYDQARYWLPARRSGPASPSPGQQLNSGETGC
jgi:hypothetical protein